MRGIFFGKNNNSNRVRMTMYSFLFRLIVCLLTVSLALNPVVGYAQVLGGTGLKPVPTLLPPPGTMVPLSPAFEPILVKGITIYPDNPLKFDFIIDPGDEDLRGEELKEASRKLIDYFMASLTVPEDQMWVNLSPYEKDRIMADGLSQTELGRDLLSQDYILKQLTASLMYPEKQLGKKFWDRVYAEIRERYDSGPDAPLLSGGRGSDRALASVGVNTFNKVWILPDKANVHVVANPSTGSGQVSVFVVDRHLKVMLEEDYLAMQNEKQNAVILNEAEGRVKDLNNRDSSPLAQNDASVSAKIIREIILPEIEREVNEGKNFAALRQIFNSMILATWYKQNLKESVLTQVYADQNKIKGIDLEDKEVKEKIYSRYIEAFKKGVYNYIKEDHDPVTQETIPRKYFSGGIVAKAKVSSSPAGLDESDFSKNTIVVKVNNEVFSEHASSPVKDDKTKSKIIPFSLKSDNLVLPKKFDLNELEKDFIGKIDNAEEPMDLYWIYLQLSIFDLEREDYNDKGLFDKVVKRIHEHWEEKVEAFDSILRDYTEKNKWQPLLIDGAEFAATLRPEEGKALSQLPRAKITERTKLMAFLDTKSVKSTLQHLFMIFYALDEEDLAGLIKSENPSEFYRKIKERQILGSGHKDSFSSNVINLHERILDSVVQEDVVWRIKLLAEKSLSIKKLRKGRIVHFRKGKILYRGVVLESVDKNRSITVLTIPPSGGFLGTSFHSQIFTIWFSEMASSGFDIEKEPRQTGFDVNIGEMLQLDVSELMKNFSSSYRDIREEVKGKKITATVWDSVMGGFNLIAHEPIWKDDSDNMIELYGFSGSKHLFYEGLEQGMMKKITEASSPLDSATGEEDLGTSSSLRFNGERARQDLRRTSRTAPSPVLADEVQEKIEEFLINELHQDNFSITAEPHGTGVIIEVAPEDRNEGSSLAETVERNYQKLISHFHFSEGYSLISLMPNDDLSVRLMIIPNTEKSSLPDVKPIESDSQKPEENFDELQRIQAVNALKRFIRKLEGENTGLVDINLTDLVLDKSNKILSELDSELNRRVAQNIGEKVPINKRGISRIAKEMLVEMGEMDPKEIDRDPIEEFREYIGFLIAGSNGVNINTALTGDEARRVYGYGAGFVPIYDAFISRLKQGGSFGVADYARVSEAVLSEFKDRQKTPDAGDKKPSSPVTSVFKGDGSAEASSSLRFNGERAQASRTASSSVTSVFKGDGSAEASSSLRSASPVEEQEEGVVSSPLGTFVTSKGEEWKVVQKDDYLYFENINGEKIGQIGFTLGDDGRVVLGTTRISNDKFEDREYLSEMLDAFFIFALEKSPKLKDVMTSAVYNPFLAETLFSRYGFVADGKAAILERLVVVGERMGKGKTPIFLSGAWTKDLIANRTAEKVLDKIQIVSARPESGTEVYIDCPYILSDRQRFNSRIRQAVTRFKFSSGVSSPINKPGGIDLNPKTLDLQTQGQEIKMNMPFDAQTILDGPVEGFVPVIIRIVPADIPLLLGLDPAKPSDERMSSTDQNPSSGSSYPDVPVSEPVVRRLERYVSTPGIS